MHTHHLLLLSFALLMACGEAEEPVATATPAYGGGRSTNEATIDDWLAEGSDSPTSPHAATPHAATPHAAAPHAAAPHAPGGPPMAGGGGIEGTVTETMDSGGYTYMLVDTSTGPVWVAAELREIEVGTNVRASGMPMSNFHSNTLNRTFDRLVLASSVEVIAE